MPLLTCPSQAELSAYLLGSLAEGQSEALERHAESCPACQEKLTALETQGDDLLAGLRRLTELDAVIHEPQCAAALLRLATLGGKPPTAVDSAAAALNPAPSHQAGPGDIIMRENLGR